MTQARQHGIEAVGDGGALTRLRLRRSGSARTSSTARYLCSVTLSSHSMSGSVNHQADRCVKNQAGHHTVSNSVIRVRTFCTVSRRPAGAARAADSARSPSLPLALPLRRRQRRSAGAKGKTSGRRKPQQSPAWPAGTEMAPLPSLSGSARTRQGRTCAGCRLSREFVTTGWLDPVQVGVLQEPAPSMRRQSRERVQRPLR